MSSESILPPTKGHYLHKDLQTAKRSPDVYLVCKIWLYPPPPPEKKRSQMRRNVQNRLRARETFTFPGGGTSCYGHTILCTPQLCWTVPSDTSIPFKTIARMKSMIFDFLGDCRCSFQGSSNECGIAVTAALFFSQEYSYRNNAPQEFSIIFRQLQLQEIIVLSFKCKECLGAVLPDLPSEIFRTIFS